MILRGPMGALSRVPLVVLTATSLVVVTTAWAGSYADLTGRVPTAIPTQDTRCVRERTLIISGVPTTPTCVPADLLDSAAHVNRRLGDASSMTVSPSGLTDGRTVGARALDPVFVADDGALCTGTGHDDTSAIQGAINTASSLGGGTVWLPRGICYQTATLLLPAAVKLVGDRGKTQLFRRADFGPSVQVGNASTAYTLNAGLDGINFTRDATVVPTTDNGPYVKLVGAENFTMRDVDLGAFFEGVDVVGGHNLVFDDVTGDGHKSLSSHYGFKFEQAGGAVRNTHPTDVEASAIYLNGDSVAGACYNWWVTSGEDVKVRHSYLGQASVSNVLVELDSNNNVIFDNKVSDSYIDVAGLYSVWMTSGGIPTTATGGVGPTASSTNSAQLTVQTSCGGLARTGGNGSSNIQGFMLESDTIKGQGGESLDGVYIDGTSVGGAFPQAVVGLSLSNDDVIAHGRNGVSLAGGVNTKVEGGHYGGNNYWNVGLAGAGIVVGANSVGTTLNGATAGGDAFGGSAGRQTFGVDIQAGATAVTLGTLDLRYNAVAAFRNLSTDVHGSAAVINAGINPVTSVPVNNQSVQLVAGTGDVVVSPAGSIASVLYAMPASAYEHEEIAFRFTQNVTAVSFATSGGSTVFANFAASAGRIYTARYVGGAWARAQ